MQSREAGQSIGGRGCQRECLQDPGRPGNAPEGQVVVDPGRSLVGRWRCGARAGSRAATLCFAVWCVFAIVPSFIFGWRAFSTPKTLSIG
jgi:hypothetical protein